MAEENNTPPEASRQRRSSFAGQTFAGLFGTGRGRPSFDNGNNSPPQQQYAGPISQAAAQAQRRRMSITTLGLSGSPTGTPYGSYRGRHDSISSSNATSIDESAIEDDSSAREPATTPVTPFARRMSFGAQALRDVRSTSGSGGGGGTVQNGTKSPPATSANPASVKAQNGTISSRDSKGRGSADFWNENMRNRAQRTSIIGQSPEAPVQVPQPAATTHNRAKSVAMMESPPREIPKAQQRPDHFQERILKGDFYMD
ncbi:hypothetical protein LTR78_002347 [Recurvomyces mirabilis]|uniref:Uncharacterized protein n=1 Tax=Recurvomyces mirabilis TaxID=574656 RepID=A0AAE0WSX9_9PEZI|nr:hypothetical protein LTR78_002347 [Recurvomyces mirabilis]KAK5157276.1 hypothetical protein LTS14_004041 [Recurvomyces mirabilis]